MEGWLIGVVSEWPILAVATLGFYVSLRVLRFPDLTVEASFIAGTVGAAMAITSQESLILGLLVGIALGGTAGAVTGLVYTLNPRGPFKLLSSVLVLFGWYTVNYRLLGGTTDKGFLTRSHLINDLRAMEGQLGWLPWRPLSLATIYVVCGLVFIFVYLLLRSRFGAYLRLTGYRPEVVRSSGREPRVGVLVGLMLGNGLCGLAGVLSASYSNYTSINTPGLVLHLLAALLLGEFLGHCLDSRGEEGGSAYEVTAIKGAALGVLNGALLYTMLKGGIILLLAEWTSADTAFFNQADQNAFIAITIVALFFIRWIWQRKSDHRLEDPENAF